jgi:hypothetical protein
MPTRVGWHRGRRPKARQGKARRAAKAKKETQNEQHGAVEGREQESQIAALTKSSGSMAWECKHGVDLSEDSASVTISNMSLGTPTCVGIVDARNIIYKRSMANADQPTL